MPTNPSPAMGSIADYPTASVVHQVQFDRRPQGGVVESVDPGSFAESAGLAPGDVLAEVNGRPVPDVLDARFRAAGEAAWLTVLREDGPPVRLFKPADADLGLNFASELFDRVKICKNNCPFCFIYQLPKQMRHSLYVKDDDYRLSFGHGNYVTLTNVTDAEFDRIVEQRLSPLYVSVHATDPVARARLLGVKEPSDVMPALRRLIKGKIQVHCQVVFCPGLNDGPALLETLETLAGLYPGTQSVAIVPVAVGRHMPEKRMLEPVTPECARQTIAAVESRQRCYLQSLGTRFAFLADEFYLLAGMPIPGYSHYEGFPQLEDGIGIGRLFQHRWRYAQRRLPASVPPRRVDLVTGGLGALTLQGAVERLNRVQGLEVRLVEIANRFFGERITVAGLLTGEDVLAGLQERWVGGTRPDEVWLPSVALRDGRFLDNVSMEALEAGLGVRARAVPNTADGLAAAVA